MQSPSVAPKWAHVAPLFPGPSSPPRTAVNTTRISSPSRRAYENMINSLGPCRFCSKKFLPERLALHEEACGKAHVRPLSNHFENGASPQSQTPVFDSAWTPSAHQPQRITEAVNLISQESNRAASPSFHVNSVRSPDFGVSAIGPPPEVIRSPDFIKPPTESEGVRHVLSSLQACAHCKKYFFPNRLPEHMKQAHGGRSPSPFKFKQASPSPGAPVAPASPVQGFYNRPTSPPLAQSSPPLSHYSRKENETPLPIFGGEDNKRSPSSPNFKDVPVEAGPSVPIEISDNKEIRLCVRQVTDEADQFVEFGLMRRSMPSLHSEIRLALGIEPLKTILSVKRISRRGNFVLLRDDGAVDRLQDDDELVVEIAHPK